jgi:membrane-bound inhibitor of C-type lysozyme
MSKRMLLLLGALVMAACGGADAPEDLADDSAVAATMGPPTLGLDTIVDVRSLRCDDGRVVSATYLAGPRSRVTLQLGDTGVEAASVVAASGARYATADESLVWWNKGDTTALTWKGRTTSCVVDSTIQF